MNAEELSSNPILSEYVVKDLNEDPSIPFPDNHFDCITNTVSVDYLSRPLEVFREMHRVLKVRVNIEASSFGLSLRADAVMIYGWPAADMLSSAIARIGRGSSCS